MAFFTQNKFNYTTGVPDGDGIYPSESSTWGDDGAGVLGNGTIAFPTAAGGAGQVLTDVAGNGTLTFASVPSTPPSGILGSVQLSDGAGGFTSDQPSFNYNSTTKRLGIGKVATTSLDVFHDDIDVNALLENVSASFDEIAVGLKLKHRSTNSMDPGLGIAQEYYIEDDTSGELLAGSITFQRQSADALRKFVVKGGTNGTQELFSIDSNREFTIEGGLRSGFGFGFTPPANSLAWNINNAGASVIIGNGGSGLGLRVLANLGNILSLEDTNQVAQVLVSNTGLVTFNDAANATADFEVKAQTTGTALFVDVSTGRVGFGTTSPSGIIHTVASSPPLFQRENSSSSTPQAGLDLLHKTSVNALDGVGPSLRFGLQDDTSAYEVLGEIAAVRDGADDEGKIIFKAGTNGSEQMASISANGKTTFNEAALSGGDFEVKAQTTGIATYTDVSNKRFGVNVVPTNALHVVEPSTGNNVLFENITSSTTSAPNNIMMKHTTSGNMADDFGVGQSFFIEDDTSGQKRIGSFLVQRDGADNQGTIKFQGGVDGAVTLLQLNASGLGVFNPGGSSSGDFRFKGQSATALYVKAGSSEAVIIGSETPKSDGDLTLDRFGRLAMKETTTPAGTTGYGCVYTKSDNKLYFQDGAGVEHEISFV
jgi:hypothetical protein